MSLKQVYISVGYSSQASIFIFHVMRGKDIGEEQSVSPFQTPLTYGILSSSRSVLALSQLKSTHAVPVTMARDFLCLWQL